MVKAKVVVAVWVCPRCGLTVFDESWRRLKPERTVCRNGHAQAQMQLEKAFLEAL